jgi:putative FmdB family regulatory protein
MMPIYEYKCRKCGQITEAWQKFSDPPLWRCELCGGPVKKIISHNTFHLKGSGWYLTDYASKSSEDKPKKKEGKEQPKKANGKSTSQKGPSKDS